MIHSLWSMWVQPHVLPSWGLCRCTKISKSKYRIIRSLLRSKAEGLSYSSSPLRQSYNLVGAALWAEFSAQIGQPVQKCKSHGSPHRRVNPHSIVRKLHLSQFWNCTIVAIKLGGVGKCFACNTPVCVQ